MLKLKNMVWFQESDIAMMAAQQYYVENGANLDLRTLSNLLPNYIPNHFLKSGADKGLSRWENLVADAFKKVNCRLTFSPLMEQHFGSLLSYMCSCI